MTALKTRYRLLQWVLLSIMTLCSICIAGLGVYAMRSTPTLFSDAEIITVRDGIQITQIGALKLKNTDLWKLPAFASAREEHQWWDTQRRLYEEISKNFPVVIEFLDETQNSWEIVAETSIMPAVEIAKRLGLIYIVAAIYIFASISVLLHHEKTAGFICAFFLSSTALYLVSVAPIVHRPIILDPDLMKILIDVFFIASTGQISIVHFAMVFPKKKKFLELYPTSVIGFYLYSAFISMLYISGQISLATTLPFLIFWIILMSFGFVHSMAYIQDEFVKKQIRTTFIALLLVAAFFIVSVVLPWPEGGRLVNNYALFSLMLPFALILSLDNQRLYEDRLSVEFNSRQEKERIHRELHDTVLNDLASISIATEGAERSVDYPEKLREKLQNIKINTAESSRQLRSFLWVIDERQNTWEEVVNSLRRLGYDLLNNVDIAFDIRADGLEENAPPPTLAVKHTIHQAFREALINVTKHARASIVQSSLTIGATGISITISDNGIGLQREKQDQAGYGLNNMLRRVKENGGELIIESPSAGGTKITIHLPLA
jgi:signal transduction histidine kinase